jgi:hypothetical protein
MTTDPLNKQVGGTHYEGMRYQPISFMVATNMNSIQAYLCKYISRYKNKGGKEDLEKFLHIAEIAKQLRPANNVVMPQSLFELKQFVAENGLPAYIKDVLTDVLIHDWDAMIEKVTDIIKTDYA